MGELAGMMVWLDCLGWRISYSVVAVCTTYCWHNTAVEDSTVFFPLFFVPHSTDFSEMIVPVSGLLAGKDGASETAIAASTKGPTRDGSQTPRKDFIPHEPGIDRGMRDGLLQSTTRPRTESCLGSSMR